MRRTLSIGTPVATGKKGNVMKMNKMNDAKSNMQNMEAQSQKMMNAEAQSQRMAGAEAQNQGARKTLGSTEEKLLEVFLQPDAPEGPGRANIECPEVRITDYLNRAKVSYHPGMSVSVGDLTKVSRDYARQVLAGAVDAEVFDDGEVFSWFSSEKYAPKIKFEADEEAVVRHDECGWFQTPIGYYWSDSVLTMLAKLDFRCHGDEEHVMVGWGRYREVDGTPHFRATIAADATELLLIVPWGGPHSQTRGLPEAPAGTKVKYFEKCTSKKGGEGYDFYILEVGTLRSELIITEANLRISQTQGEMTFFAKRLTIDRLKNEYEAFSRELDKAYDVMNELHSEICSSPFAEKPYVTIPNFRALKDLQPKKPVCNFDMELDEIRRMEIPDEDWLLLRTMTAKMPIVARAWLHFAPKYDALFAKVAETCYGWLEIGESSATVYLPDNGEFYDRPVRKYTFAFSEVHVKKCIRLVEDYVRTEAALAELNDHVLFGDA